MARKITQKLSSSRDVVRVCRFVGQKSEPRASACSLDMSWRQKPGGYDFDICHSYLPDCRIRLELDLLHEPVGLPVSFNQSNRQGLLRQIPVNHPLYPSLVKLCKMALQGVADD